VKACQSSSSTPAGQLRATSLASGAPIQPAQLSLSRTSRTLAPSLAHFVRLFLLKILFALYFILSTVWRRASERAGRMARIWGAGLAPCARNNNKQPAQLRRRTTRAKEAGKKERRPLGS